MLGIFKGLEWLNSSPLTMSEHLMGKVAVLDFFTYCCMNCMHVIPDLEALEQKYSVEEGVVVVGVHSAKFQNEKVLDNVRNAVLRHSIHHPVVNDPDAFLWNELLINCWPTFVLLGPENQYIHSFAGEGNREKLLEFVQITLDYYKESQTIQSHSLPISLEKDREKNNFLQFPGKLCVNSNGSKLYIADSGNNRILVCDTSKGCVQVRTSIVFDFFSFSLGFPSLTFSWFFSLSLSLFLCFFFSLSLGLSLSLSPSLGLPPPPVFLSLPPFGLSLSPPAPWSFSLPPGLSLSPPSPYPPQQPLSLGLRTETGISISCGRKPYRLNTISIIIFCQ